MRLPALLAAVLFTGSVTAVDKGGHGVADASPHPRPLLGLTGVTVTAWAPGDG
jgi:hypothetical protein